MIYRTLGSTGERVSAIGVGGWHLGLKHIDEGLAIRIVRSALAGGSKSSGGTGTMVADEASGVSRALIVLTFSTGLIDALSFLALGHVFTANMTGNVVFLAFAVGGATGLSAARSGTSLLAFMAGAV